MRPLDISPGWYQRKQLKISSFHPSHLIIAEETAWGARIASPHCSNKTHSPSTLRWCQKWLSGESELLPYPMIEKTLLLQCQWKPHGKLECPPALRRSNLNLRYQWRMEEKLDFYLHLSVIRWCPTPPLPQWYQREPVTTKSLNKIQRLRTIQKYPDFNQ